MAQPVWSLTVDLQTKTATFQTGMADAARAARGSFDEIKSGAATMGRETSGSMTEARHGVMLLGEEFGIHLPRGITSFLASLGPVAAAMEAAFPFLAIIVGATLLLEHLAKLKEANSKVGSEWDSIEESATKALNKMGEDLLLVEMESDRLAGRNLAALHKQLELIDHQTLGELESAFDALASKIDATLKAASRGSLMTTFLGEGASDKVKAEFDKFKTQYDALLSAHDDPGARGALVDEIIHAQEQLKKYQAMPQANSWVREAVGSYSQLIAQLENVNRLDEESVELNAKKKANTTTQAQDAHPEDFNPELFVEAQNKKRVSLAETIELIKKQQKVTDDAAKLELEGMEGLSKGLKEIADERAKLAQEAGKEDGGHATKMAELQAAADREAAQMKMAAGRMSGQEYLNMELGFAAQEYEAKKAALQKELAALDQSGKEYENKKRELNNRLLELDKQFQNQKQVLEDQGQKTELATIKQAESRMEQAYAQGFSQVIMGKKSFSQMMAQLDGQILESAMQNMIMAVAQQQWQDDKSKFSSAEKAAAKAFAWAPNPLIGAPLAAAAFAAVMAFEGGGLVPGVELGDVVPARLEPGETVLPKRMTERLNSASDSGNSNRQPVHVHMHNSHTIHALDSQGMDRVLAKHADKLQRHFEHTIRKMNR